MSIAGVIAVNRFGLGARAGDITRASRGPEDWLWKQLDPKASELFSRAQLDSSKTLMTNVQAAQMEKRRQKQDRENNKEPQAEQVKSVQARSREVLRREIQARMFVGSSTDFAFHERLARFWSNHFSVSAKNPFTTALVGSYEREAIRPHILGQFDELAVNAITHPAMLIYLDNRQSVGPNSKVGQRGKRGLNENLAREVLELHTVTPAARYTQDDVTEFAKALTGWTLGGGRQARAQRGETIFEARIHEPGVRRIMGAGYADNGRYQAISIIKDLSQRPETAQNIAFKLARHFTADEPPASLVEKLKRAFLDNGGDLMPVYKALIEAPESWSPDPQKVKTPDELLTSTARLLGPDKVYSIDPRKVMEGLAQIPFTAPSPEGWPDTADAWLSPNGLMKRIEWANRIAEKTAIQDGRLLLQTALGELASETTVKAVSRAESGEQALALALLSPEFQRR